MTEQPDYELWPAYTLCHCCLCFSWWDHFTNLVSLSKSGVRGMPAASSMMSCCCRVCHFHEFTTPPCFFSALLYLPCSVPCLLSPTWPQQHLYPNQPATTAAATSPSQTSSIVALNAPPPALTAPPAAAALQQTPLRSQQRQQQHHALCPCLQQLL